MKSLYLALVGNFVDGFKGQAFSDTDTMNGFILGQLAQGRMASSIEIERPADASQPGYSVDGKYVVMLGDITRGIRAIGPFETEDDADECGEDGDILDDNTYSVLTLEEAA